MNKAEQIYNATRNGGHITDEDVLYGIEFYKVLNNMLAQCGPVFKLTANEAGSIYLTLESFLDARRRN